MNGLQKELIHAIRKVGYLKGTAEAYHTPSNEMVPEYVIELYDEVLDLLIELLEESFRESKPDEFSDG